MFSFMRNVMQRIARSTHSSHKTQVPIPLKKHKYKIRRSNMNREPLYQSKSKVSMNKILVAFDFDKTLIDVNSDTHVMRLLPKGGQEAEKYQRLQWIEYMQKVFDLLCTSGVKPAELFECLGNIPWTKGMPELVNDLSQNGHDLIIISDCNSVFINTFLAAKGMEQCFRAIFTNPAEFDGNGCLKIKMFHQQNWCELSAINLCKGNVLDEFIKYQSSFDSNFRYKFVAYVGDGMNDYCPMLRLKETDLAFPRMGFPCAKQIATETRPIYHVKATVVPWVDGFQIRDSIYSTL